MWYIYLAYNGPIVWCQFSCVLPERYETVEDDEDRYDVGGLDNVRMVRQRPN